MEARNRCVLQKGLAGQERSNVDSTHPTITGHIAAVKDRSVSYQERVVQSIDRLESIEPKLNTCISTFADRALDQAKAIDKKNSAGEDAGPLAGVPIVLKDNICLDYGATTCASRFLENYESPFAATAAKKLIDAGAIVIAKTNLDEFAMGSSCEHSAFGPTRNPWDHDRVPGGSSGGSAAAVAAGIVPAALGSDTGGSIRQPAAFCGVVGLKPTYGRVSRYGLVAFASSLDQIGPITRTVQDAATMLNIICGHDPLDSTSADKPVPDFTAELDTPIEGLRLGVPTAARNASNHESVNRAIDDAAAFFQSRGAKIIEVDLPHADHTIAAYYIVAPAEASSNLARYDGVRFGRRADLEPTDDLEALYAKSRSQGFGPEVQRRIMLGTYVLSAWYYDAFYNTALKARRLIKADYDAAFEEVDALLMPTTPGPAFKLGQKLADPLTMYQEDVYTVGASLAGLPAISVPAGLAQVDGKDLPIGIQFITPAWEEAKLLRVARMFEQGVPMLNYG